MLATEERATVQPEIERLLDRWLHPKNYCDIHEHLCVLRQIAERYPGGAEILELGTRQGKSTTAFLAASPKRIVSVDIDWSNLHPVLRDLPTNNWLRLEQDSRQALQMGMFDILFVDTMHNEKHVRAELDVHLKHCRDRVIFHDTETNKTLGDDGGEGIWKPIEELLSGEWSLEKHYANNNGLTVIRRVHAE